MREIVGGREIVAGGREEGREGRSRNEDIAKRMKSSHESEKGDMYHPFQNSKKGIKSYIPISLRSNLVILQEKVAWVFVGQLGNVLLRLGGFFFDVIVL